MPALRIQTALPLDLRDQLNAESANFRGVLLRRFERFTSVGGLPSQTRRSKRLRTAGTAWRTANAATEFLGCAVAESLGVGVDAVDDDPRVKCCRLLRLDGLEELQDLIASLVLSECVYKKLELDEEGVVGKVSEFVSFFPPGWVQLQAVQLSLSGIPQHYLVATSPTAMYVAFMGTKQFQDILADANLLHTPVWAEAARLAADQQSIPAAHRGFLERARAIHVEQLYELAVSKGLRLVLCGHSLGGAVAKLCTLRLLRELPDWPRPRVRCIAFATPAVGNAALAELVENAGWASHFASYYLPEDQLVRLISFSQERGSTAARTAAAASGGAAVATVAAGSPFAQAAAACSGRNSGSARKVDGRKHEDTLAAFAVSNEVGRSPGGASAPVMPFLARSDSSGSLASSSFGSVEDDTVGSGSSWSSGALLDGSEEDLSSMIGSSGSLFRDLPMPLMSTSSPQLPAGDPDTTTSSSPLRQSLSSTSNITSRHCNVRTLVLLGSEAGSRAAQVPGCLPVLRTPDTDRIGNVANSAGAASADTPTSTSPTAANPTESLDDDQAGAAVMAVMEEILAPGPDVLEAAAAPGVALQGALPVDLAAAQQEALYGKGGGSWGLRLALGRRRAMRRMRRLAARARIPLPKALLPVPRYHTFGEQWFVTEEGALAPEEVVRRISQDRAREQQRDTQSDGARGFFSHHRMLAYRQRHVDIISGLFRTCAAPSTSLLAAATSPPLLAEPSLQRGPPHGADEPRGTVHHNPALVTPALGTASIAFVGGSRDDLSCPDAAVSPSSRTAVPIRKDIMPSIVVQRAVLSGVLPSYHDGDDDAAPMAPKQSAAAAVLASPSLTPRQAVPSPLSQESLHSLQSPAEGGLSSDVVAAAASPQRPTGHHSRASPFTQLMGWMASVPRAAHAGARRRGTAVGVKGGSDEEPVQLELHLEGKNLQYCRNVSVSLVRHSGAVSGGGAKEESGESTGMPVGSSVGGGRASQTIEAEDVPCEIVQMLYAQPYSDVANPPPLHPVSLLRNSLHHIADRFIRRCGWQQQQGGRSPTRQSTAAAAAAEPRNASGESGGGNVSANPPQFRLGVQLPGIPPVMGGVAALSGGFGLLGPLGAGAGPAAQHAPAMSSRLLLRATLPRAVACGLLDGTLPAHLAVSARSDFHAISSVQAAVCRPKVAILGTSPYAAALVQAALAAPAALAAADRQERAAARGMVAGGGAGAAAAWLAPAVARALAVMRGLTAAERPRVIRRVASEGAGKTHSALVAFGFFGRSRSAASPKATGAAIGGSECDGMATVAAAYSVLQGPEGAASLLQASLSAQLEPPQKHPERGAPVVDGPVASHPMTPAAAQSSTPGPMQSVTSGTAAASASPATDAPSSGSADAAASWRVQVPPLGRFRGKACLTHLRWSVRQTLAAAAFGAAAASAAGVTGAVAAVGAAAGMATVLASTAVAGGADGSTTLFVGAGVTVAAVLAAAAAATASVLVAGGEAAALAATAAAVAVTAALAMAAATTSAAPPVPLQIPHPPSSVSAATAAAAVAGPALAKVRSQAPSLPLPSAVTAPRLSQKPAGLRSGRGAAMKVAKVATAGAAAGAAASPSSASAPAATGARWGGQFYSGAITAPARSTAGSVVTGGGTGAGGSRAGSQSRGSATAGAGRSLGRGWMVWWRPPQLAASGAPRIAPPSTSVDGTLPTAKVQVQGTAARGAEAPPRGWMPWQRHEAPAVARPGISSGGGRSDSGPAASAADAAVQSPAARPAWARAWFPRVTVAVRSSSKPTSSAGAGAGVSASSDGSPPSPTAVRSTPLEQLRLNLLRGLLSGSGRATLPLPPALVAEGMELCNVMVEQQQHHQHQPPQMWPPRQRLQPTSASQQGPVSTFSPVAGSALLKTASRPLPQPTPATSRGGNRSDMQARPVPVAQLARSWGLLAGPSSSGAASRSASESADLQPPEGQTRTAASSAAVATAAAGSATTPLAAAARAAGSDQAAAVVGVGPFVAVRRMSEGLRRQLLQRGWWWRVLLGGVVEAVLRPVALVGRLGRLPAWGLQVFFRAGLRRQLQHLRTAAPGAGVTSASATADDLSPGRTPQNMAGRFDAAASATAADPNAPSSPSRASSDWSSLVMVASCRDPLHVLRARDMTSLRNQAASAGCPLIPVLLTCSDSPLGRRTAALRTLAAACGVEPEAVRVVWLDSELLYRPAAAIPLADLAAVWRSTAACEGAAEVRRTVRAAVTATCRPEGQKQQHPQQCPHMQQKGRQRLQQLVQKL